MKQILQDMSKGDTTIVNSPAPSIRTGHLLIETTMSLISSGTERMLVDFGKSNYLQKAMQQPDKVKMVLEKVKTDGLITTLDAVQSKLAQPLPLGYCNVGKIFQIGNDVKQFKIGDRIVSNGPHADIVRVSKNLCALIPDGVDDESAAFVVLASIGLQGIRLAAPTLGESIVVTGVGLIGLLTIQLLKANGCRVLAIDHNEQKLVLARQFGAQTCNLAAGEDPVSTAMAFSRGNGVDAVVIAASTKSSDPVSQAAQMSRKKGRIVLVGVTGLELNRSEFYEKELSFQVSCSYGPGRYDTNYEEKGQDYPIGFVRWTEQRNFEAILDMLADGRLDVKPLITHRILFDDAISAYDVLTGDKDALGIILNYRQENQAEKLVKSIAISNSIIFSVSKPVIGFIGAGNYASRVLIPAFKKAGAQLHTISTSSGVSGVVHGEKNNFKKVTTDTEAMLCDNTINTVVIVTQHNSHARFVQQALEQGKNVFVEKPLALNAEELSAVEASYFSQEKNNKKIRLMVGFNRRFSPQIQKMKSLLSSVGEPKSFIMTINSGAIPKDHWTQSIEKGGGRIIGEACHFVDLMRFLSGSEIVSVQARRMSDTDGVDITEDKAAIVLGFADGSFGTILYLANGAASYPKERIEVFAAGKVLMLDNFRKLKGYGWNNFSKMNLWQQDKGQEACASIFIEAVLAGKPSPISAEEIFEVTRITIEIADLLRNQE